MSVCNDLFQIKGTNISTLILFFNLNPFCFTLKLDKMSCIYLEIRCIEQLGYLVYLFIVSFYFKLIIIKKPKIKMIMTEWIRKPHHQNNIPICRNVILIYYTLCIYTFFFVFFEVNIWIQISLSFPSQRIDKGFSVQNLKTAFSGLPYDIEGFVAIYFCFLPFIRYQAEANFFIRTTQVQFVLYLLYFCSVFVCIQGQLRIQGVFLEWIPCMAMHIYGQRKKGEIVQECVQYETWYSYFCLG
eukprot:TRINITY_DN3423_c0_g1_i2.p1 TRINITY_DN3423_c0_g1~~TRINITY_DN3423_c0_g1_i2.p1  ORF type:complete len:242 (-),score=-15.24 TRINITY_DN3423_c0_g1_i2:200-925(-)